MVLSPDQHLEAGWSPYTPHQTGEERRDTLHVVCQPQVHRTAGSTTASKYYYITLLEAVHSTISKI